MMPNIKVLDCTLRDGGYVNNWEFGIENAKAIIKNLHDSNIDYIEIGFLTNKTFPQSTTLFKSFEDLHKILPEHSPKSRLIGMIKFGEFNIENVPQKSDSCLDGIRLIFKKHQIEEALNYSKILKEKGFKLFINPTYINLYSENELIELIEKINKIKPYGISIVDSMGVLTEKELFKLYEIINSKLDKDVAICFHSHNNLQLSFSNARYLIYLCKERELIIDSSILGIGRGSGNLSTELIAQYINDNFMGNYNLSPILKIVDEQINPIFEKHPWGYSIPYYLSAIHHCHINYAKFLLKNKQLSSNEINQIFQKIPTEFKANYNEQLIEKLSSGFYISQ